MNKVLKYFGGNVGKFMLFILPALAYVILTVFYDATVIGWVVTACVFVTMLNIGFGGKEIVSVSFAVIGLLMELFRMFSNYLGDTTFGKSHYWEVVVEMRAIVKFYIIGLIATIALFTAIFLIIFRAKKGIGKLRILLILCLVLAVAGEAYCFFNLAFIPSMLLIRTVMLDISIIGLAVPLMCCKICHECGYRNELDTGFCGGCGYKLK